MSIGEMSEGRSAFVENVRGKVAVWVETGDDQCGLLMTAAGAAETAERMLALAGEMSGEIPEIWPDGEIAFGRSIRGRERCVVIALADHATGRRSNLCFREANFVALADHLRMAGDAVLDGSFWQD